MARWIKARTDRGRRPKMSRTLRAGAALAGLLTSMDTKGRLALTGLWSSWDQVLGPEIAAMAKPLGRREKTLVLASDDPIVAQQLGYFSPQILERVNGFLGQEVFDKVVFELLNGRIPLDGARAVEVDRERKPLKRPDNLGKMAEELGRHGLVGGCYRAYVKLFAGRE
ncbi:MAG: DUF721 domain-containing protein [Desulfovibrionaceae bacterium]|nr:DUF721 domain-containing protein [Desulfovibrionaceae bacterium]